MKKFPSESIRVLGIAPSSRGFGFAVIVGENTLVDWGVKPVKSGDKNARSLSNAANLIARYKPNVIAIEDAKGSRRGLRVQALITEIILLANQERITIKKCSRKEINFGFFPNGRGTKQAIAELLADRFPEELSFRLPRRRRLWTSEDYQMDIFE